MLKHANILRFGTQSATTLLLMMLLAVGVRAENQPQISVQRDIVYRTINGEELKLDLAAPVTPGKYPLIICIHGGAWHMGDKTRFTGMVENLARHNYVAATLNYRLAPKVKYPAPYEDIKTGLTFLKLHADKYHIDVEHVGGTGESAGSNMAILLAFKEAAAELTDKGVHKNALQSMKMQAIVNYYSPIDLTCCEASPMVDFLWMNHFKQTMRQSLLTFADSKDLADPNIRAMSPINFVNEKCPPILTFHGTKDPVVPFMQAELLHQALKKVGVPQKLVSVEEGAHGGWPEESKKNADQQAIEFFDHYLKGLEFKPETTKTGDRGILPAIQKASAKTPLDSARSNTIGNSSIPSNSPKALQ